MNIQDLKSNTTWQEASNTINNNNNKISLAIATLENATLKNKGYFTSVEKLNEAIPNPTIGSKAYVGTSEPYAIYIVENGVWADSGYTGGDEIVAKITTDRIEDGAVTSEKIATSAVDDTPIAGSNKLVKSGGVYEAIASKSEMSLINEDGFHIVDENLNVGMKYNENGLDISKVSSHFIEVLKASGINVDNIISSYASLTNEDGFFIIDEELNIGVKVDNNGIHAKNILEYEIIEN